ncbi:hypothetical protein Rxycam_00253 [Rubrobacter xylanophilus DSM 9941]|nr:hypothetical protein Rxycam_00253 [Rubrobacter xylanophilus DSM 9941]
MTIWVMETGARRAGTLVWGRPPPCRPYGARLAGERPAGDPEPDRRRDRGPSEAPGRRRPGERAGEDGEHGPGQILYIGDEHHRGDQHEACCDPAEGPDAAEDDRSGEKARRTLRVPVPRPRGPPFSSPRRVRVPTPDVEQHPRTPGGTSRRSRTAHRGPGGDSGRRSDEVAGPGRVRGRGHEHPKMRGVPVASSSRRMKAGWSADLVSARGRGACRRRAAESRLSTAATSSTFPTPRGPPPARYGSWGRRTRPETPPASARAAAPRPALSGFRNGRRGW